MKVNKIDTALFVLLLCFVFITIVVYYTYDIWAVQVLSACLGAIITIIATRLLLSSQTKIEEQRRQEDEKAKQRFEIYNAKLGVYSKFVSRLYGILGDYKIEEKEILEIRTTILGQISFYANGDILGKINEQLKNVKYEDIEIMTKAFANIAGILQNDLKETNDWSYDVNNAVILWNTFNKFLDDEQNTSDNNQLFIETANDKLNFWHFNMWSAEKQIEALQRGIYELNLAEYGNEQWRTDLIREVMKDDIILLYRSGGQGYVGVYKAIGWRIFEFDENREIKQETLYNFSDASKNVITDQEQMSVDLERSDIYNSKEDGARLCSSIIVKPLAFSIKGVGRPGGLYRRTISRYRRGYGLKVLSRFMSIMKDENEDMKLMHCDVPTFEKLLKSENIQPATRDEKGNWQ